MARETPHERLAREHAERLLRDREPKNLAVLLKMHNKHGYWPTVNWTIVAEKS